MFLDCTLRDGGYYNSWDFSQELIEKYLNAITVAGVEVVELGFRSTKNNGFLGPCAFTSEEFINNLQIPSDLLIGVMINASEIADENKQVKILEHLFPCDANNSKVRLVRIACHFDEINCVIPAVIWLKERGFLVGVNLMQIADRTNEEITALAKIASNLPVDVLYFADSMGSLSPNCTSRIIDTIRIEWKGDLGIHTHDNLGLALSNTLRAMDEGVTWVDSTVCGMGRGPGNSRTEELALEISLRRRKNNNMVPLLELIKNYFKPMQLKYGWGSNPYYYLAGKYGIHPSFIQEMLSDTRYCSEDILAVIDFLRKDGGKKFISSKLDTALNFYNNEPEGTWSPRELFEGRELLLLGTGPGVDIHRNAIEKFIEKRRPLVMALNTQNSINPSLIDLRVACHPVRMMADFDTHLRLPQPLIAPYSMLSLDAKRIFSEKKIFDFGIKVQNKKFESFVNYCVVPKAMVIAYALAIVASGDSKIIYMAGFDGYEGDDSRNHEMDEIINLFRDNYPQIGIVAITPSRYNVVKKSVYNIDAL